MTLKFMYKQKSKTKKRHLSAKNSPINSQLNSKVKLFNLIKRLSPSWQACLPIACLIVLGWGYAAVAQTPAAGPTTAELKSCS